MTVRRNVNIDLPSGAALLFTALPDFYASSDWNSAAPEPSISYGASCKLHLFERSENLRRRLFCAS